MDETYDNEDENEYGVTPLVYLVPEERLSDVHRCAKDACRDFHTDWTMCIGDYFEERMSDGGIDYRPVGEIKLTFKERREDYLSDETGFERV